MTASPSLYEQLSAAFNLSEMPGGILRAPHFSGRPGVVFGGQLIGQAVIAATRRLPGKQVRTVQTTFVKGATTDQPVDIHVETMHDGRTVGSATVSFVQGGRLCARSLILLDVREPDLVRHQLPMPEVAPPDPAKAQPHWMAGPETIVVGEIDVADPELTGPPRLQLWIRFPDAPAGEAALARALLSHATDGWLIGTAMRPHAGLGQSMAHTEVSTGVLAQDVTFHDDFDASDWLLVDHHAQAAGGGHTYGRGHVFTAQGALVASFVQQALLRRFPAAQDPRRSNSPVF